LGFGFVTASDVVVFVVSAIDGIAGRRTTVVAICGVFDFDGSLGSVADFVFGLMLVMPFFVSASMVLFSTPRS
jgi:hypothetical protein